MADTTAGSSPPVRALFLGPTRIHVDGGDPLEITNLQARLLAQLAIAAPSPLNTEQLLDALWPTDRPANARASLYNQVSRLRARVGVDIVRSVSGAYSLAVPTDLELVSDTLLEVERLMDAGDYDEAERRTEHAMSLWRGEPLAELPHDDARAGVIRRRAAETLRSLSTLRVQAAILAGRTGWAIPEAERLVGETPHDERRWALLLEALGAAGRRGDALAAYERARRELADSLGLEPGAVLTAAYDQLLLPVEYFVRGRSALVSREEFIAELLEQLEQNRTTLLYGEHGIGKTRLLTIIANRLIRSGVRVASVTATRHATMAAQILQEICEDLEVELDSNLPPTQGFVEAIQEAADGGQPIAILIDDVSNLGPTSAIALAGAVRIDGVSLVLTSRTLLPMITGTTIRSVQIPPLTEEQIRPIIEDRLGTTVSDELVSWVATMSGGNPQLVELLASEPQEELDECGNQSETLARVLDGLVQTHTELLSERARRVLEVLAVLGPAPRSLIDEFVPARALDELLGHGLLAETAKGLIQFRHGALHTAVYNATAPGHRAEYHAFVLRLLDRLNAAADRVAPHAKACEEVNPLGAARALLRAALRDAPTVPAQRAKPWFRLVLSLAKPLGDGAADLVAAAQIGLAHQLRRLGRPERHAATDRARELADGSDHPLVVAEAAQLAARVDGLADDGTVAPSVIDLIERAFTVATAPEHLATVLIGTAELPPGASLERAGRRAALAALDALDALEAGESLARLHTDGNGVHAELLSQLRQRVHLAAGRTLHSPADLETCGVLNDAARDSTTLEYVEQFDRWLADLARSTMECDGATATESAALLRKGVSTLIDCDARLTFELHAALLSYLREDFAEAERTLDALDELIDAWPNGLGRARALGNLAAIRLAQGRELELVEELASFAAAQPSVRYWTALHARCLVRTEPERAAALALEARDESLDHPLWALTAAACAAVGLDTMNVELSAHALERLGPWSGQFICSGGVSGGLVDAHLAGASLVLGRFGQATEHLSLARQQVTTLGAPVLAAELDRLAERITKALLQNGVAGAGWAGPSGTGLGWDEPGRAGPGRGGCSSISLNHSRAPRGTSHE